MRLMLVSGARPNFVKIAPIMRALHKRQETFETTLVHTGQHYDEQMSAVFFAEFGLLAPDVNLGIGSGTHAEQTGKTMIAIESACLEHDPDLVIVVGDVNATLAAALAAKKLGIAVAHVEAGLRAHDQTMPEEINRLVTDRISDLHFTTDHLADENLQREGISPISIHRVGNVMIDSLLANRTRAVRSDVLTRLGVEPKTYALVTLHRGSNVDRAVDLERSLRTLALVSSEIPVVLPLPPRTRKRFEAYGASERLAASRVKLIDPLGYLDFLKLMDSARFVMTDSGGAQEETTILGIPSLTLRTTTERPITCQLGTNQLVGVDPEHVAQKARKLLSGPTRPHAAPPLWDGRAAERLVSVLEDYVDLRSLAAA
jgi:UDP-N-acetylglucosamine 2-epimerase (non-hydrolysing)